MCSGDEGIASASIDAGFLAATVGLRITLVAFGARFRFARIGGDFLAATCERITVFPIGALGGCASFGGSGGFDAVTGGRIDNFAGGTSTKFLMNIGGAWSGLVGLHPNFIS